MKNPKAESFLGFTQPYNNNTRLMAICLGLPGWAGTRKVKPMRILLKQETVGGSGISWAICKSALRPRQIPVPAPDHSISYRPDALPATQPTASKHWRKFHTTKGEANLTRSCWFTANDKTATTVYYNFITLLWGCIGLGGICLNVFASMV